MKVQKVARMTLAEGYNVARTVLVEGERVVRPVLVNDRKVGRAGPVRYGRVPSLVLVKHDGVARAAGVMDQVKEERPKRFREGLYRYCVVETTLLHCLRSQ